MKNLIREIQIIPVKPNNGLVAYASFVLFDSLYVTSVGVHTRLNWPQPAIPLYRLVYPNKKIGEKSINLFYPINREIGYAIEKAVSQEVYKVINQRSDEYARYGQNSHPAR